MEFPPKAFSAKFGTSLKRLERQPRRQDLTLRFRRTLERCIEDRRNSNPDTARVVICVDELDKIEHSQGGLQVVNELKDLMHVSGSHFLMSVSDEALEGFSLRGIPVRDAIDSTFDEIVELASMSVGEANRVVVSRAPEFPPPLTRFCFAWSLGNPRDLLRVARHCLKAGADSPQARRGLGDIVNQVVQEDVRAAVAAQMRRTQETTFFSLVMRRRLLSAVRKGDVSEIKEVVHSVVTMADEEGRSSWEPLECYLQYADEVLAKFDAGWNYGEWLRRTLESGWLDENSEFLVDGFHHNRGTWRREPSRSALNAE